MLYLCSGQNDLVHQYECSVLSNDKSTVINLCRKMTVTYYYITHQVTSAGLTIMHLEYSNVLSPYPTPHPSPYPSEMWFEMRHPSTFMKLHWNFKILFFYFQYFMFVILQLFNIILIYMGAVECLKEKAEHECIYILLLIILYKEDVDIECDIFFLLSPCATCFLSNWVINHTYCSL